MKRYDIFWAQLDPTMGTEMRKARPVVIVSRDEFNKVLSTVTVCPLTSQIHSEWRTRLTVKAAGRTADIAAEQIRTISKMRLGKKLGTLSNDEAAALRRLITALYAE